MSLVTAGWILVILYMLVILFFVIRGALKVKNISDYAVGSIDFSPSVVGLSLAASITSAATFIINPGFIALFGLSGILALCIVTPIALSISLIIFTKGFRKYGSTVQANTMAQWIGKRYDSPRYSLFFGILSLLLLTFIVLICVGLTKVLSSTLNVGEFYMLIGIIVFVFGYMMFGGANSMVYTNTIQACIMLVVAFILLGSGYEHFQQGISGFIEKLKQVDPNLATMTNAHSPIFRDYFEIMFCGIVVGVALICQPHIITKSLLLKTNKDVNKFLFVGISAEIIFFLVVIVGLYARLSYPDVQLQNGAPVFMVAGKAVNMDGLTSAYVVDQFSVYLGLVVVLGLISAGISTLESLIQSLSTTITSDIIHPIFGKFLPQNEQKNFKALIYVNRAVIIFLAIATFFVSYNQIKYPNLSVGIFAQNGVFAYFAAAFVPVLFGVFFKNVPKIAPIAATITAVCTHFYIYYVGIFPGITKYMWNGDSMYIIRNPGIAAAVAIIASLFVGLTLYFMLRDKQHLNEETV